jgi:osmoprotectant transport system permease protein
LVAWGGLGRYIIDGFSQRDNVEVFVGGVLVALLAVATELFFEFVERRAIPVGIRVADTVGQGQTEQVRPPSQPG